jgi:hypothetical protein
MCATSWLLRLEVLSPHLNERQRRLLLGTETRLLGHGGIRAVAQVAGVSEITVRAGVFELEEGQDPFPGGRARRQGGGRKGAEKCLVGHGARSSRRPQLDDQAGAVSSCPGGAAASRPNQSSQRTMGQTAVRTEH